AGARYRRVPKGRPRRSCDARPVEERRSQCDDRRAVLAEDPSRGDGLVPARRRGAGVGRSGAPHARDGCRPPRRTGPAAMDGARGGAPAAAGEAAPRPVGPRQDPQDIVETPNLSSTRAYIVTSELLVLDLRFRRT